MNPNSIILKSISRLLVFLINIFALYLILRGHNHPGGGFIAGLVTAMSLVLLNLSLGLDETRHIIRFDPVFLAVIGLALAYLTSSFPVVLDHFFLKHGFWHARAPLIGEIHIGSPLFFDLGVYLTVVGITAKIIMTFSYLVYEQKAYFLEETFRYKPSKKSHAGGEKK